MTEPCHCDGPNADCTRSGLPMLGRLFDLCKGIGVSPQTSENYRRLWDGTKRPRCRHLGNAYDVAECPTCNGWMRIKLYECRVHTSCTLATPMSGRACCGECPDYQPK